MTTLPREPLDEAHHHLVAFEMKSSTLDSVSLSVEGVVASYVATLVQRVRSTYVAMKQLLLAGHHDEMVLLLRRQLEDSMRLHYLTAHGDEGAALVLGHQRERELKVLKQLDRVINNASISEPARTELKRMAQLRRGRISEIDDTASKLGLELEGFPEFHIMAAELGRDRDLMPYASASEVSHSAVSAATDGYVTKEGQENHAVQVIGLTSQNPLDRLGYARAAINTTGLAVMHGLIILGLDSDGLSIGRDAATRVESLGSLQVRLAQRGST
ncbi:MAG: DUF5677 domain-containing protein [Acidimicrobiia bacterium]